MNGELNVQIKTISKDQARLGGLNPSWFPLIAKGPKEHIVQEVEMFDGNDPYPSLNYVNNLYINLLHLSVKANADSSIQVKVQFKRSDNIKSPAENVTETVLLYFLSSEF